MKQKQATHLEFFQAMAKTIATKRRQILGIIGNKKNPTFFYTVGNQEKNLPELLLIGNFSADAVTAVLNTLSDQLLERGKAFDNGELISVGGDMPVAVWDAMALTHTEYTIQAGQFYGNEDYQVQQVVVPDKKGRWPGDPLCHKGWRVPVLKQLKLNS